MTEVVDGDTLVVTLRGRKEPEKVRLLGIDTAERGTGWHKESLAALRGLANDRPVVLEFEEPGKIKRDKYGRILSYVFVGQANVNVEMVRQGWSAYVFNHGGERYSKELAAAEEEARAAHRGIWESR